MICGFICGLTWFFENMMKFMVILLLHIFCYREFIVNVDCHYGKCVLSLLQHIPDKAEHILKAMVTWKYLFDS